MDTSVWDLGQITVPNQPQIQREGRVLSPGRFSSATPEGWVSDLYPPSIRLLHAIHNTMQSTPIPPLRKSRKFSVNMQGNRVAFVDVDSCLGRSSRTEEVGPEFYIRDRRLGDAVSYYTAVLTMKTMNATGFAGSGG